MKTPEHIHYGGDGRAPRDVFVNGEKVDCVVYANTKTGIVKYCPKPIRVNEKTNKVIKATVRGSVEVKYK